METKKVRGEVSRIKNELPNLWAAPNQRLMYDAYYGDQQYDDHYESNNDVEEQDQAQKSCLTGSITIFITIKVAWRNVTMFFFTC